MRYSAYLCKDDIVREYGFQTWQSTRRFVRWFRLERILAVIDNLTGENVTLDVMYSRGKSR